MRQVRNAPINIQNVVTYDVVVEFKNPEFRLKPGMTANVAIVVAKREQVLKVPNSVLRFNPPKAVIEDTVAVRPAGGTFGPASRQRVLWKQNALDELEPVSVEMGISDGTYSEIAAAEVHEGDQVVIGIEAARGDRKGADLPPGFGSGQQRSPRRDRGI